MDAKNIERFQAWASLPRFQRLVADAKQRIEEVLTQEPRIYVAYSGGKDSSVLLHLVLQQKPDVDVVFIDHGRNLLPKWLADEAVANAYKMGAKQVRVFRRPQQVVEGKYVSADPTEGWMFRRIATLGYPAVFVGIRAQESVARRRRGWRYEAIRQRCYAPLFEWQARDIWTYIVSRQIPYLSHYDRMARWMDYEEIRFGTVFQANARGLLDLNPLHAVAYYREYWGDIQQGGDESEDDG